MNERDKIAIEQLVGYVDRYRIFIDTCSLMEYPFVEAFWQHIIPILQRTKKKIFLPYKCWLELKKHSCDQTNPERAHDAKRAMETVKRYQTDGYISIKSDKWETDGTFADNTFKTVFTMYRDRYDLLLITQDNKLAKETLDLNNSQAVYGKKVAAKRINKYGFLSHYDWEENNSLKAYTVNGNSSTSRMSSNEAFRLCTKVSNISSDTIHLSYVPKENDAVLAKTGQIRLGKQIAYGGEGTVYETNTQYVAKIYHDGKLTHRKYEKLKRLVEKQLSCEGICFPVSGLYNQNQEFVGYLMPKAKGKELQRSIFIKPLFLKQFPNWKKKDLVKLCITILEKMQYLHERNIIMGDINAGNILVQSPDKVYFVDTDSYQIEDLPCPVGIVTFTPPELQGKEYKTFLRTMGNEYFAVATLLFMLMLPGKSPYAQQGGEDPATNIKNMDFSYPFEDKSNQKTPDGLWGFIWSHLSYKLKEAFWHTFHKDGRYSSKSTRLPVAEWIKLFNQYYYELTEGNMLKNDEMSGELFPTRLKKNPNATYIICKLCNQEIDEKFSKNGICFNCQKDNYTECKQCARRVFKSELKKGLCKSCQPYATITCTACGKKFTITNGEKEYYDKKNLELPKRCKECRDKGIIARTQSSQSNPSPVVVATASTTSKKNKKTKSAVHKTPSKQPLSKKAPKTQLNVEEELKKKRAKAVAIVLRIWDEEIHKITGFHPIKKRQLDRCFEEIYNKILDCTDFNEIDRLVKQAKVAKIFIFN